MSHDYWLIARCHTPIFSSHRAFGGSNVGGCGLVATFVTNDSAVEQGARSRRFTRVTVVQSGFIWKVHVSALYGERYCALQSASFIAVQGFPGGAIGQTQPPISPPSHKTTQKSGEYNGRGRMTRRSAHSFPPAPVLVTKMATKPHPTTFQQPHSLCELQMGVYNLLYA